MSVETEVNVSLIINNFLVKKAKKRITTGILQKI